jgi:hypothetical protein
MISVCGDGDGGGAACTCNAGWGTYISRSEETCISDVALVVSQETRRQGETRANPHMSRTFPADSEGAHLGLALHHGGSQCSVAASSRCAHSAVCCNPSTLWGRNLLFPRASDADCPLPPVRRTVCRGIVTGILSSSASSPSTVRASFCSLLGHGLLRGTPSTGFRTRCISSRDCSTNDPHSTKAFRGRGCRRWWEIACACKLSPVVVAHHLPPSHPPTPTCTTSAAISPPARCKACVGPLPLPLPI